MKTSHAAILFAALFALLLLWGCKSPDSRTIVTGGKIVGVRVFTASTMPTPAMDVFFGSGQVNYVSIPNGTDSAAVVVESKDTGWFTSSVTTGQRIMIFTGSGVGQMKNVPSFDIAPAAPATEEGGSTDRQ